MSPRIPVLCLLSAIALVFCIAAVAVEEDAQDALLLDDGQASADKDSGFSVDELKTVIVEAIHKAIDLIESQEERIGKTVDINKETDVTASTGPYTLANANIYRFSGDGAINVEEDGVLKLGLAYTVEGDPAIINMDKGSYISVLGMSIKMPVDLTIRIEGSLKCDIICTGDLTSLTLHEDLKGSIDLDGSISIGPLTMKSESGNDAEVDLSLDVKIDPLSALNDIRKIAKDIFGEDNGVYISLDVKKLTAKFGGMLGNIDLNVNNAKADISSPIKEHSIDLDDLKVMYASFDSELSVGSPGTNHLLINELSTTKTGDETRFEIWKFELFGETPTETLRDHSLTSASFNLEIEDRFHMTLHDGDLTSLSGTIDMDLDILDEAEVYLGGSDYIGELHVSENAWFSGTLTAPFRAVTHIVIKDVVDIRFAGDEEAYIYMMPDLDYLTKIYPDEGLRLIEFKSDRYVEYTIDEYFSWAVPASLKGMYHAELGSRLYELMLGDDIVIRAYATQMVDLPEPEPIMGKVFIGWSDRYTTYRGLYEMPAHDVMMDALWADLEHETEIADGFFTVKTECPAIVIDERVMKGLKLRMLTEEITTFRIVTQYGMLDMHKDDVADITGDFMVYLNVCPGYYVPDYEKPIDRGLLCNIDMTDSRGKIEELTAGLELTFKYTNLEDNENVVRVYKMDRYGILTEIPCEYEFTEDGNANVTFHTDTLPYCVVKSFFEQDKGASRMMIAIAMIPVVVLALILAIITRRH